MALFYQTVLYCASMKKLPKKLPSHIREIVHSKYEIRYPEELDKIWFKMRRHISKGTFLYTRTKMMESGIMSFIKIKGYTKYQIVQTICENLHDEGYGVHLAGEKAFPKYANKRIASCFIPFGPNFMNALIYELMRRQALSRTFANNVDQYDMDYIKRELKVAFVRVNYSRYLSEEDFYVIETDHTAIDDVYIEECVEEMFDAFTHEVYGDPYTALKEKVTKDFKGIMTRTERLNNVLGVKDSFSYKMYEPTQYKDEIPDIPLERTNESSISRFIRDDVKEELRGQNTSFLSQSYKKRIREQNEELCEIYPLPETPSSYSLLLLNSYKRWTQSHPRTYVVPPVGVKGFQRRLTKLNRMDGNPVGKGNVETRTSCWYSPEMSYLPKGKEHTISAGAYRVGKTKSLKMVDKRTEGEALMMKTLVKGFYGRVVDEILPELLHLIPDTNATRERNALIRRKTPTFVV